MKDNPIRLDDLKRQVPFEVPEGYFDKLPAIIQARIPATPEPQTWVSWSWQRSLALAGAMSLIFALIWFTYPQQQGPLGSERLSQVSDEAILEYLADENISYYDLSENNAVQTAFKTDSTVLYYLDDVDKDFLRNQLDESILLDETI